MKDKDGNPIYISDMGRQFTIPGSNLDSELTFRRIPKLMTDDNEQLVIKLQGVEFWINEEEEAALKNWLRGK